MTTDSLSVLVEGEQVQVRVRKSERARRIRLRVNEQGAEVVIPRRATLKHAAEAVRTHEDWLVRYLTRYRNERPETFPRPGKLMFEGSWHTVETLAKRAGCDPTDSASLERWMRAQAADRIFAAVAKWGARMGLIPKRISIRDQKTKWGACSTTGTITFNWRVVMAPSEVLEYLVVHELAHMREMNHSSRFWAIVEAECPDWRPLRHWLKFNGNALRLALA